jgi:hypothetical protein
MKDREDKSTGIVARITEALAKIKPTTLKIGQACRSEEKKLLRFLR